MIYGKVSNCGRTLNRVYIYMVRTKLLIEYFGKAYWIMFCVVPYTCMSEQGNNIMNRNKSRISLIIFSIIIESLFGTSNRLKQTFRRRCVNKYIYDHRSTDISIYYWGIWPSFDPFCWVLNVRAVYKQWWGKLNFTAKYCFAESLLRDV